MFKDFLKLLWDGSSRRKQLFLTGTTQALRFLRAGRSLDSVLSKDATLKAEFIAAYGARFERVAEFFRNFEGQVEICDLSQIVPAFKLKALPTEEPHLAEL